MLELEGVQAGLLSTRSQQVHFVPGHVVFASTLASRGVGAAAAGEGAEVDTRDSHG